MRNEIQILQKTLNTINTAALTHSAASGQGIVPSTAPYQTVNQSPSALADRVSPAAWSARSRASEGHRMAMTRENSPEPAQGAGGGTGSVLVTEPMGGLYEVTRLRNIRSNQTKLDRSVPDSDDHVDDFIARGRKPKISIGCMLHAFATLIQHDSHPTSFHISLNHYLWVGLEQLHSSLASVRRSSQLLTATILTVTALHIPSSAKIFDDCYNEFLNLISSSMFSKYHSVDDVRGLCIAAFWLSDGTYVCDHHFSIAYGRPPMISESLQIREHETFLELPLADALDFRILSQVNLFQILTRVHDCFAERRLPHQDTSRALLSERNFPQMRSFNLEIDQWRILWHSRQKLNEYIGSFPPKGIILYSYFAKFQLNSFAVRGVNLSGGVLSTERKEFANMAVSAAASSLTFVLEEEDLRRALVGTPLYVPSFLTRLT
ncbi:hypothetical protein N7512_003647 [Penicillium capsulatum]|nr:hypothetical protein N7512_003647 [Penicillium capsulatum]